MEKRFRIRLIASPSLKKILFVIPIPDDNIIII